MTREGRLICFFSGAVVGDTMLNKAQLTELARGPNLDMARGELCSILQMPARKVTQMLESNPQALSRNLEQYVKDQSGESTEN